MPHQFTRVPIAQACLASAWAAVRRHSRATVVLGLMLLSGCAGFVPEPPPGVEPPIRYATLTVPITVVGDTQEHEATGFPLHDNDSAVDAYVEVAQRPPEQPLFGRRILEWVLENHPNEPFLHLGDVLDLSCQSELQRMSRIFATAGQSGAVLPGNHDGLMFGVFNSRLLDRVWDADATRWNQACRRGTRSDAVGDRATPGRLAVTRRGFIAHYIRMQSEGKNALPGLKPLPDTGDARVSWRNPDTSAFVSAIEINALSDWRYAQSFMAQRLRLPAAPGADRAVYVIGLDTNQVGTLVSTWDTLMGRSPGSVGHVNLDQIRAVTPWVTEAARNGDIVIFAAHHNWSQLSANTRLLLSGLMSNTDHPLVWLSAHTHRGFWAQHRNFDMRPILELNVSSLSDWPIAYRRISFGFDAQSRRLQVRGDLMPNAGRRISNDRDLMAAWESGVCDRSGLKTDVLRAEDVELVYRQRSERGNLFSWLLSGLAGLCESCEQPLYDHAQQYQDALLEVLTQVEKDLGEKAHQIGSAILPAHCGKAGLSKCAATLKAEQPEGFKAHVDLFRRKAQLVDAISTHLDELRAPEAKAYMACRAVQAAKIDFDSTSDDVNASRTESKRRIEQFFRVEASVGME